MVKINRVKRLRFELDWNQSELAEKMGCDQSLIAKIETGAARLTPRLAEKLIKIISDKANDGKAAA